MLCLLTFVRLAKPTPRCTLALRRFGDVSIGLAQQVGRTAMAAGGLAVAAGAAAVSGAAAAGQRVVAASGGGAGAIADGAGNIMSKVGAVDGDNVMGRLYRGLRV